MSWLLEGYASVRAFFEAGGWVLGGVFLATVVLWTLIVERLWWFQVEMPALREMAKSEWSKRTERSSWHAHRIRERIISRFSIAAHRNVGMVRTWTAAAPLLGLLGTVIGMISVFEVIARYGTDDGRALSSGISLALLPTMAGMVAAISGLYHCAALPKRAAHAVDELADELRFG